MKMEQERKGSAGKNAKDQTAVKEGRTRRGGSRWWQAMLLR